MELADAVVDVERQGQALTDDVARDDVDRAVLAECAGDGQDRAVHDRPPDRRQRDAEEPLQRRRAEDRCGLLLLGAELLEHRHDLADDERQADEDRGDRIAFQVNSTGMPWANR